MVIGVELPRLALGALALVAWPGLVPVASSKPAPARPPLAQQAEGFQPERLAALKPDEVEIEYIAHACFRLRSPGGKRILIDPYASRVWIGYDFPEHLSADAVLITHPHYDHDGGRAMGADVRWMEELQVIDQPGSYETGDVRITGIRGKHADPYGKEFGQINTIWLLDVAGLRIAHLGDNGPLTRANVEELGRVDVLLIPIDAQQHILAREEIEDIRNALHPRILVPMHYRLSDLEPDENKPDKLGPIDPWLEGQAGIRRLDGNSAIFSTRALPDGEQVVVFQHSPEVVPPGAR